MRTTTGRRWDQLTSEKQASVTLAEMFGYIAREIDFSNKWARAEKKRDILRERVARPARSRGARSGSGFVGSNWTGD